MAWSCVHLNPQGWRSPLCRMDWGLCVCVLRRVLWRESAWNQDSSISGRLCLALPLGEHWRGVVRVSTPPSRCGTAGCACCCSTSCLHCCHCHCPFKALGPDPGQLAGVWLYLLRSPCPPYSLQGGRHIRWSQEHWSQSTVVLLPGSIQ